MSIDVATEPAPGLRVRVEKVIEIIRPAIQADDGDIELHEVDEATGEVTVEFAENAGLIGGMRVKIGDDVFDGSVKTRLTSLSESF